LFVFSGFPTEGERKLGFYDDIVNKFNLRLNDAELKHSGGKWSEPSRDPLSEHVVEDERIITGSNPASASGVADRMLTQLKKICPINKQNKYESVLRPITEPELYSKDRIEPGMEHQGRKERI
jgi:hypothetical protein